MITYPDKSRSSRMKSVNVNNRSFGTSFSGNIQSKGFLSRSEWFINAMPNDLVDNNGQGPACWGTSQLSFRQQISFDSKFYILEENTPKEKIMYELGRFFGPDNISRYVKLDEYTPYAYTCRSYWGSNLSK